ncbi:hypothetical protein F5887DRAFT_1083974 [Amanita rubescens]|nr:hypothetical protein F5887DRAFT_1083974 [Amanita rubescens]
MDNDEQGASVDLTVAKWIQRHQEISTRIPVRGEPEAAFQAAEWALTGYDRETDEQARIVALHNRPKNNTPMPYIRRDYDSLIGFTSHIPARASIFVYGKPNASRALTARLKIKVPFVINDEVSFVPFNAFIQCQRRTLKQVMLDPSTVPNTLLAQRDLRHQIRVFFPGLKNRERTSSALTSEESATFYDIGLRPAILLVAPTTVHDWPPSYASETFRSSDGRGRFTESTRVVSSDDIPDFSTALKNNMNAIPWGKNMVFGTEIRGIKNDTEHQPHMDDAVQDRLDDLLHQVKLPYEQLTGSWFIDVAIELIIKDKAVVWREDCYPPIMQRLFDIPERVVDRVSRHRNHFEQDVSQHLTEVAGFRAHFSKPVGQFDVLYMQAYTTDKSLTYHPTAHHFAKFLTGKNAMDPRSTYTTSLAAAYEEAREKNDVAARLEVRVPVSKATRVLRDFSQDLFMATALVFPRQLWWNVRIVRLEAANIILFHLNSLASQTRCRPSTLYTYAALVWLINGLHNRPPSDQTGRAVARIALPLTSDLDHEHRHLFGIDDDLEDDEAVPFCPGGMMFLRRMTFPPNSDCARLMWNRDRTLPDAAFQHIFRRPMTDLRREMDPIFRIRNKPTRPRKRYTVSRKMSALRNPQADEPDAPPPESFTLNLRDVALVRRSHLETEWGEDVAQMHEPLSDDEADVAGRALEIWRQFASDVVQKIGNPMGTKERAREESYCILPPSERMDITVENLKDPNLAKIFRVVFVKRVNDEGWMTTFDNLFPPPNRLLPASHQQYTQMRYYDAWMRLMQMIGSRDIWAVRRAVKNEFNKLAWAPAAQADRIWIYRSAHDLMAFPAKRGVDHAPRIVWNPKQKHLQPQFIPPAVLEMREEEEEGSDEAEQ